MVKEARIRLRGHIKRRYDVMGNKITQLVSLVNASNFEKTNDAILQALNLIQFDFNKKIKKIAIKPNLCYYWKSSTGETTDPRVVESVIDIFRAYFNPDEIYIIESDATVMRTKYSFKMLDYEKIASKKNVKLVNLCNDELIPTDLKMKNSFSNRIKVPKTLMDVDLFISVPKLKSHSITGLTCALKNQFGCIPYKRKIVFHKDLDRVIAFVNKLIPPDLILVDGIVTNGKTPKKLNLIMAGYDPVAVDYIASKIVGINHRRIKHIVESEKLGVGSINVKCIGDDLSWFADRFPRKGFFYSVSRKALLNLYGIYLRLFTLEGKIFEMQPTL